MKFAVLGVALSTLSLVGVSASTVSFSAKVPSFNGKATTPSALKSESGNVGYITITKMENEEVTFRIGPSDGKNYGANKIIHQDYINEEHRLNYKYTYGAGQSVNVQYNNHNWTNHRGQLNGTVDYK